MIGADGLQAFLFVFLSLLRHSFNAQFIQIYVFVRLDWVDRMLKSFLSDLKFWGRKELVFAFNKGKRGVFVSGLLDRGGEVRIELRVVIIGILNKAYGWRPSRLEFLILKWPSLVARFFCIQIYSALLANSVNILRKLDFIHFFLDLSNPSVFSASKQVIFFECT